MTGDERIAWILSYPKEARKLLLLLCESKLEKRHIIAAIDRNIAENARKGLND